ncbi:expressed unknown protein [Seminavis robusta]|uniref:Uncharacterized protein n=1 Tax=Seminavis robusta TaxID=568900 RepID=A0A9N8DHY4_9STRA|nr:expressed unknown protein [Seminavis robusta]|eukprot:Sro97_g049800.1 n/a (198) ;mRNA; r:9675-10268
MVVFVLYCQADLEGIESVSLSKDSNLCFSVRNPQDVNEVREKVVVDSTVLEVSSVADHEKHRDETPSHFAMKWKDATHRSTLRILGSNSFLNETKNENDKKTKKNKHISNELQKAIDAVRSMTSEDSGHLVPMLALDCNGLEPYAFHPMGVQGEFVVVTKQAGGKKIDTVDLSDGDWADYAMDIGSVSITNFTAKFQ